MQSQHVAGYENNKNLGNFTSLTHVGRSILEPQKVLSISYA